MKYVLMMAAALLSVSAGAKVEFDVNGRRALIEKVRGEKVFVYLCENIQDGQLSDLMKEGGEKACRDMTPEGISVTNFENNIGAVRDFVRTEANKMIDESKLSESEKADARKQMEASMTVSPQEHFKTFMDDFAQDGIEVQYEPEEITRALEILELLKKKPQ